MTNKEAADPWEAQGDLLGFRAYGETFTNLVKSLDEAKVISIEAGFGRGKTFFRTAWAEHLRQQGEVVVEIDARQSDYSGDPVVSFLGALLASLPEEKSKLGEQALKAAKKFGAAGIRTVAKVVLRSGVDEVIDLATENAADKLEDFEALQGLVADLGEGMSKAAGQIIASQLAAEKVRQHEMPAQLKLLREALTNDSDNKRIVIIIDELDRCHPDYAIATLEAMKLVFDQAGYVFCLMVNADYLENLARHRFGDTFGDELYLDKFVDIRLKLKWSDDSLTAAVRALANEIPQGVPFGDGKEFSITTAANIAADLAVETGFSMRKIKRVLLKVEIAMRCYGDQPVDLPLLVFLAFQEATKTDISTDLLPRARLTSEFAAGFLRRLQNADRSLKLERVNSTKREMRDFVAKYARELATLPPDRYSDPDAMRYEEWRRVFAVLAPCYLPRHKKILSATEALQVD